MRERETGTLLYNSVIETAVDVYERERERERERVGHIMCRSF